MFVGVFFWDNTQMKRDKTLKIVNYIAQTEDMKQQAI